MWTLPEIGGTMAETRAVPALPLATPVVPVEGGPSS